MEGPLNCQALLVATKWQRVRVVCLVIPAAVAAAGAQHVHEVVLVEDGGRRGVGEHVAQQLLLVAEDARRARAAAAAKLDERTRRRLGGEARDKDTAERGHEMRGGIVDDGWGGRHARLAAAVQADRQQVPPAQQRLKQLAVRADARELVVGARYPCALHTLVAAGRRTCCCSERRWWGSRTRSHEHRHGNGVRHGQQLELLLARRAHELLDDEDDVWGEVRLAEQRIDGRGTECTACGEGRGAEKVRWCSGDWGSDIGRDDAVAVCGDGWRRDGGSSAGDKRRRCDSVVYGRGVVQRTR